MALRFSGGAKNKVSNVQKDKKSLRIGFWKCHVTHYRAQIGHANYLKGIIIHCILQLIDTFKERKKSTMALNEKEDEKRKRKR